MTSSACASRMTPPTRSKNWNVRGVERAPGAQDDAGNEHARHRQVGAVIVVERAVQVHEPRDHVALARQRAEGLVDHGGDLAGEDEVDQLLLVLHIEEERAGGDAPARSATSRVVAAA